MGQGLEDGRRPRTNKLLVYFKKVVQAFSTRFNQLGGKIAARRPTRPVRNNVGRRREPAERREGRRVRDVDLRSASCPGFVSGLRTLGNNTPILNSWAGDGTYWIAKGVKVSNYYAVTFASAFGDDPNPAVNKLAKAVKAGTGGFVTGAAAIDGVVTAITRARAAPRTARRSPRRW